MRTIERTAPCEYCGKMLTKTATQQAQRKYWTCDRSCANKLRIRLGNTPNWAHNPDRGVKESRPCAVCGTPVTRYLSQQVKVRDWTCSRACAGKLNRGRRIAAGTWQTGQKKRRGSTTPCAVCGAPVYANRSERAKGQGVYCSRLCSSRGRSKTPIVKSCANCGKEMRLKPSQAALQFCSRDCMGAGKTKRPGERMHNGRPIRYDAKGYVLIWEPTHPNKSLKGWQLEHRVVAEKALGRYLRSDEHIHHVNHRKDDNAPANLQVMDGIEHAKLSGRDYRDDIESRLAELEAYRDRFGPLKEV